MNVLILGSGGREHALAWKASQSPLVKKLYCAPGSDAIDAHAERAALDILDAKAVAAFCKAKRVDLVMIGPEAPLAAGVSDGLAEAGLKVFGPNKAASLLEGSKAFAKEFLARHGVPTARFEVFEDSRLARQAALSRPLPMVIKADGLAAGKGVRVCRTREEALAAVIDLMERRSLGDAGRKLLVEDCLEGPELSVLALCDGKTYKLLPLSRDHKRLKDGDKGPNTGGMGAFAPVDVEPALVERVRTEVLDPVMAALKQDGFDYRGVLYVGLMLTKDGPSVLEFNCRFGDPEAQAILPLLDSDIVEVALACAEGRLAETEVKTKKGACVAIVLAAEGYPEAPVPGRLIELLAPLRKNDEVVLFHAGTKKTPDGWVTAGGRVIAVTALGSNLGEARGLAYTALSRISFRGMQYRRDIAAGAPAAV